MNRPAIGFHVVFWSVAYGVWLFTTTAYHPTWPLRLVCTAVLVGASALYACCFVPRSRRGKALLTAVAMLVVCGAGAAATIHVLYDAWLGPDPRRFPFVQNLWMDTAVVLFNTTIAALSAWLVRRLTGLRVWSLWPAPSGE